jgi:hypothetical protein
MTTLPTSDLADLLRAWTAGISSTEAAIELLIAHDVWVHRPDFVAACIESYAAYDSQHDDLVPVALIHFETIPTFVATCQCLAVDRRVLLIVAAIANECPNSQLGEMIIDLDGASAGLVLGAIAGPNGSHEHRRLSPFATTRAVASPHPSARSSQSNPGGPSLGQSRLSVLH